MNKTEYEWYYKQERRPRYFNVDRMYKQEDRTLTFGYDTDRNTWHVYLKDSTIWVVLYTYPNRILHQEHGVQIPHSVLRPNKRSYPEWTDVEFADIMREDGHPLTFTTWDDRLPRVPYAGLTIGDYDVA